MIVSYTAAEIKRIRELNERVRAVLKAKYDRREFDSYVPSEWQAVEKLVEYIDDAGNIEDPQ